ncbi:hypothetical protein L2E82_50999 [Cichorium intybus]|nr:hypothetical protein L2E82_50999 [Cichorium intybus]
MCKCRSHGTFPLFGLQSSHLNICYYHQDPHRRPLRPGSRPRFCSDRRALLLIGAWHLPRRPGVGRALKRHPFSGLVDSAGELLHHSLADFDFHDHRPAVLIDQHPLWVLVSLRASTRVSSGFAPLRHSSPSFGSRQACSHSNPSQKIKVGRRCTPLGGSRQSASLRLAGLLTTVDLAHMSDSLVRVSRRAEWGAHRPVPGARRYIAETARAANHDRRDGISTSLSTARALAAAPIRTGPRPESIGGPAIAVPHPTGTHRRPPFASLPTISSTL